MHSGITNNKANQGFNQLSESSPEDYQPMESCNKGNFAGTTTAALAKERDLAALQRTRGRNAEARVSTAGLSIDSQC